MPPDDPALSRRFVARFQERQTPGQVLEYQLTRRESHTRGMSKKATENEKRRPLGACSLKRRSRHALPPGRRDA